MFILSRLDYCNIVFAGLPKSATASLQWAKNATAHLVTTIGSRDDSHSSTLTTTLAASTIWNHLQSMPADAQNAH